GGKTMRLDDLPESGNVEDRRAEGYGGGGGFGMPIGGGGLSIGAIVALGLIGWALGIDPSVLIGGAGILTGPRHPPGAGAAQRATHWYSPRSDGPLREQGARQHRAAVETSLRERRQDLSAARARSLSRRNARHLRRRSAKRHGTFLLSH